MTFFKENLPDGCLLRLSADLPNVDAACREVKSLVDEWGLAGQWFQIHLVLREVLNNGVIHGCRQDGRLEVELELRRQKDALWIRVKDQGPGFKWDDVIHSQPEVGKDHGRGMPILMAYTRTFAFNPEGNEITIIMDAETNTEEETMMEITRKQDWTVVAPQKDVVSAVATELRKQLKSLVDSGQKKIELDMKKVEMMDSMGLGLLIALHNSLKDQGGQIRVVNLSEELMELFRNMRLDRHFEVSGS